jgi:hypothetical protein
MCNLCKTYGQQAIDDAKKLQKAMNAITPAMLNDKGQTEHLRSLVDAWMGFVPGAESDDPEKAEAWEKSHR